MNILLEGPDGSGKSTLAKSLSSILRMQIVQGKGPVNPSAAKERFSEHLGLNNVIFDRHVCVSEMIYGPLFQRQEYDYNACYAPLYRIPNMIIIYCRAPASSLIEHTRSSPTDTDEYLEQLNTHFAQVVQRYDEWALKHAHLVYRRDGFNPALVAMINEWSGRQLPSTWRTNV